jgi:branched-chain amino acid transport system permease protein
MGTVLLIDAVIVVIIGGMGSYNGTIIGGLLVGFVDIFGRFFLPISSIYLPFILLIIFLFWRPEGMYGEKGVFD